MAVNPETNYGVDVACVQDADPMWSEVTGVALVRQDTIHVLTCDSFLGPNGDGRGFDVHKLLGMPAEQVITMGPTIAGTVLEDERILTCDVLLTPIYRPNGTVDIDLEVQCTTALGPFTLTGPVSQFGMSS
jgi:hypothetical protein